MVRNLCIWLLLIFFLISTFPLKNVISTKSTFSDENASGDAFSLPFAWGPEERRNLWDMNTAFQLQTCFTFLCRALWTLQCIHEHRQDRSYSFCRGRSIQTLHLNSRCWLLALSVICCHRANSGATTSRHLVGRKSAISIKVHIFLHLPWKA